MHGPDYFEMKRTRSEIFPYYTDRRERERAGYLVREVNFDSSNILVQNRLSRAANLAGRSKERALIADGG